MRTLDDECAFFVCLSSTQSRDEKHIWLENKMNIKIKYKMWARVDGNRENEFKKASTTLWVSSFCFFAHFFFPVVGCSFIAAFFFSPEFCCWQMISVRIFIICRKKFSQNLTVDRHKEIERNEIIKNGSCINEIYLLSLVPCLLSNLRIFFSSSQANVKGTRLLCWKFNSVSVSIESLQHITFG